MKKLKNQIFIDEMRAQISEDMQAGNFRHNARNEDVFMSMGADNVKLAGIVTTEPHLQEVFMSVFYDRIVRRGYLENLSFVNELEIFHTEDNTFGATFSRTMYDIVESSAYDPTASPVPQSPVMVAKEVFADAIIKRIFEFSFSDEQMRTAFLNETGLNDVLTSLFTKLDKSKDLYLRDVIMTLLKDPLNLTEVTIANAGFKLLLNVPLTDLATTLTALNHADALEQARAFKTYLLTMLSQLEKPSRLYNKGDVDGKFMSNIEKGEAVLLIHPTLYATLQTISDELFGQSSEFQKRFKKIIDIDLSTDGTVASGGTLLAIVDPRMIEYSITLEKTLEWTNPKALYTNYFSHLWFQTLVNPFLNGLRVTISEAL